MELKFIFTLICFVVIAFCVGFAFGVRKEGKRYEKWLKERSDGVVNVFPVKDKKTGEYLSPEVYLAPNNFPQNWRDGQKVIFFVYNRCPREKT